MSQQILVAIAVVLMAASSYGLDNIGEHDQKFYWVEKITMNFSDADAFCARFGWELVTMDSESEFLYLQAVVSNHTSVNGYWTSAISTDTFKWNKGIGNVVDPTNYPINVSYSTCIVFRGPDLYSHPCDGNQALPTYPLCQMRNARFAAEFNKKVHH